MYTSTLLHTSQSPIFVALDAEPARQNGTVPTPHVYPHFGLLYSLLCDQIALFLDVFGKEQFITFVDDLKTDIGEPGVSFRAFDTRSQSILQAPEQHKTPTTNIAAKDCTMDQNTTSSMIWKQDASSDLTIFRAITEPICRILKPC